MSYPKPVLFTESPTPVVPPPVTLEQSKAISRNKAYEAAIRNLITAAGAVLITAFCAVPPEQLAAFISQLGVTGTTSLLLLAALAGLQKYLANRAKHPPNSD